MKMVLDLGLVHTYSFSILQHNFFSADWPPVHMYPLEADAENVTFRKRSPESKFLKTAFSCFVWTLMELSENNDVSVLVPGYPRERKYISASHKSA